MADIIITNGIVVTMDPHRRIIENGAVAIDKDRIVAVGPTEEVLASHQAPTMIDASRKIVMPGLIDGHAHAGHGLIKTMGGGDSDAWYEACHKAYTVASTPEFWRAEARLAALERLRFGVTTGVSLLGGGDTILRTDEPIYGDAHCEGVREVGTRSVVAVGPTRPPHPRTYARIVDGKAVERPVSFEEQFETCKTLIDTWHGKHGGRLNIALITPTLRAEHLAELGAENLEEAKRQARLTADLAKEAGLVFTQDGHTKGSVAYAKELGILGPNALLSHSTNLTEDEIRIVADTGTSIAHNPSAIASILGRCPVPELLEAGANVCLGSDATAPDRSGDMFRHMQQCMHYHRTYFKDPTWLPPGRVLEMCTIDGARALGMDKDIGSLEVGKKADVVLLDLRRPHLYPLNMPVFRLIYFANGNDVDTVIVDGRIALQDRKALFVDEDEVLDDAQRETDAMLERTGFQSMLETPKMFWHHVRATDQIEH
ncbi:amidohydrolase family protein [Microvirga lotononidis]|uniref:Cytosine deaminase-like metal-dependent hydrolase n=1 Tax=Microvirga lotononidis TaxID=864069 RepID=I4YLM0_9HYPH|nr:amidohydrolase family protein [Microvirga lotononidis]EIM24862.1 cytosine deaminase-like metal-dependent hydrolase [Microvirga lotononidis]WQO29636.1 amidohydrolase family protein [Microvirga lotononidis]